MPFVPLRLDELNGPGIGQKDQKTSKGANGPQGATKTDEIT